MTVTDYGKSFLFIMIRSSLLTWDSNPDKPAVIRVPSLGPEKNDSDSKHLPHCS